MMRLSFVLLSFFVFISPALAGFEWVPPSQTSGQNTANKVVEAIDVSSSYAPPPVASIPLEAPPQVQATVSGVPQARPQKTNLSGKKLVIDPYPLRNNVAPPQETMSTSMISQAMNEASGNLNPVQLGNGMKTSGMPQKVSLPVPTPERMASTSQATQNNNLPNSSMTPMMGGEPMPLHGVAIAQESVMNQQSYGQYANAIGFGRELPLALALSQVIPSEFTHSYGQGVDAGATVSWEGGKPWNIVLNEMLRSVGMIAVIRGKQVVIQPLASL